MREHCLAVKFFLFVFRNLSREVTDWLQLRVSPIFFCCP